MIACLFSGGKDSTLALHKAYELGAKPDILITFRSANPESYMFHYPNVEFTKLQAEALGIKQVIVDTKGVKEEELKDLEKALIDNKVSAIITGATYSRYQADRINNIAQKLGIEHIAPLWHIDPFEELNEIARKFNAIITSVSAEGLSTDLLGKRIDENLINELKKAHEKYHINMLFEGGEAESFVLDAPLFKKRIKIKSAEKKINGMNGVYIIKEAVLEEKKE